MIRAGFRWRTSGLSGGIPLTGTIIGFSNPPLAPHRLYAHCDDGSVWRILVWWRLGVAIRVAS